MSFKLMPLFRPTPQVYVQEVSHGFGHVHGMSSQAQGSDSRHIIVCVSNDGSGPKMLDLLRQQAESFGLRWIGTLGEELARAGVNNASLADDLPYRFALLRIEGGGGSEATALRDLYRFECRQIAQNNLPPFIAAEPDYPLRYSIATKIGANYDLRAVGSMHDDYCKLLNVNGAHRTGLKGDKVTVAVVDSGVEKTGIATQFQDLQDPANTSETDDNGHGTAMTSIIRDIAPDADVHAIRISDGFPRMWKLMMGVSSASFHFQADIINLSLGLDSIPQSCSQCGLSSPGLSTNLEKYLQGIAQKSVGANGPPLLVASSGNERSTAGYNYPATWDFTVAVGAINSSKTRSDFSNYEQGGTHPRFFVMPGGDEYASGGPSEWIGKGDDAECLGTSPATAYASAMLALYYSSTSALRDPDRDKFLRDALAKCDSTFPGHNSDEYGKGFLPYR